VSVQWPHGLTRTRAALKKVRNDYILLGVSSATFHRGFIRNVIRISYALCLPVRAGDRGPDPGVRGGWRDQPAAVGRLARGLGGHLLPAVRAGAQGLNSNLVMALITF
jgi:hypothetical protein